MLTAHFTWLEVIYSPTAARLKIDNRVPNELHGNVERTAREMEGVRTLLGVPLDVTSWFRCAELNAHIGGSPTSAHMKGLAVDSKPRGMALETAFDLIAGSPIQFDQLIHERTRDGADWIHVGFTNGHPRREVLRAQGLQLGGDMSFTRVLPG